MKHLNSLLVLAFFMFLGVSCGTRNTEKEQLTDNESQVLKETNILLSHLEVRNFINTPAENGGTPSAVTAKELHSLLAGDSIQVALVDVRPSDEFESGHIEGAINTGHGSLLQTVKDLSAKNDKVVLVGTNGNEAGYLSAIFQLLGNTNVFYLKWGMASWNPKFADVWRNSLSNDMIGQLEKASHDQPKPGDLPAVLTEEQTAEEILGSRAKNMLSAGFDVARISLEELQKNPADYFLISYMPEEHYDFGHYPGSVSYQPYKSFSTDTKLNTIPVQRKVVIICHSGHAASQVTAFLRLIGYNARCLEYGANTFMNSTLTEKGWGGFSEEEVNNFPVVSPKPI